jgi:hypothetical protein
MRFNREKSSQSRQIHSATLSDEKNRRFVSLAGGRN